MNVSPKQQNKERKTKPNRGEYKLMSTALVRPKNCVTSVVRCTGYQVYWLVLRHSHGKRYIKIIVFKIYWVYRVSTSPYYWTIDCLFWGEDKSLSPVCIYFWPIRVQRKAPHSCSHSWLWLKSVSQNNTRKHGYK